MKRIRSDRKSSSGASAKLGGIVGATVLLLTATAVWAAGPVFWDWPSGRALDQLRFDGAAVDPTGALTTGWSARPVGPTESSVYWSLADDGAGGFFTGTGHEGEIYHTDADGGTTLFATLGASEVLSLLVTPDRGVFAGTAPEGKLFHIDTKGQVKLVGTVDGGYIWALASGSDSGTVWVAAGAPASLYRYEEDPGLRKVASFPATNVLDVALARDGSLRVATQGPGLVYRVDPGHTDALELLLETPQDEARSLVTGPDGQWYVLSLQPKDRESAPVPNDSSPQAVPPTGLSPLRGGGSAPEIPRAALWRLGPDAEVSLFWSGDEDFLKVVWSEDTGWLAGGPAAEGQGRTQLRALEPPAGSRPVAVWRGGDILDLLLQRNGNRSGRVLVAQGHSHAVIETGPATEGLHEASSAPLDAGRPVRWGRMRWDGTGNLGGVRWSVRGGNRSTPDDSWTPWSDPWNDQDHELELPRVRYAQWRVEFSDEETKDPPRISSISVSAWRQNSVPRVQWLRREMLRGVESGGLVSHAENLTQTFRSGLRVEFDRQRQTRTPVTRRGAQASRAVEIFTWLADDPDSDSLECRLEYRARGDQTWRSIGEPTGESLLSWDTNEVADGIYEVRLVVSDAPDNPSGSELTARKILSEVRIDNTEPEISKWKLDRTETGLRIRFEAHDRGEPLGGAQLTLPDGTTERLDPVDGICDSTRERFDREVIWPRSGLRDDQPWPVRVEVRDLGGNVAAVEGEVR